MKFSELQGAAAEASASWFYDQSRDGFAISKGGVILKVNQAWCDILGIDAEDAVGQTAADIVSAGDLGAYGESEARLVSSGEDEFDLRLNTARGAVWVKGSVRRGADGYALIVARDVTEERRQAAQTEAAKHIRALLWGRAGVLTWTFSPASGEFHVDVTRDAATGVYLPGARTLSLEEMLQQVDAGQREGFVAALMGGVDTGEPQEYGFRFRYREGDGRTRHFDACWRGLSREDDGRWLLAGLTRDLTELMEARDAALAGQRAATEADRVKSRFLANMSHEFRTPLNGVLGVLHLLRSEPMSPEAERLLEEATASGRVLTSLLNDLVDLSDLDAGRLSLSCEEVDPGLIFQDLLSGYEPDFAAKTLSLETASAPDAPPVVADPLRLRQILAGLLDNALKFTEGGGVVARLSVVGEGAARRVRFEIEDTGIGIAPETMSTLFNTFRQVDDGSTRRFGGVGSGLFLSRSLARLMGGDVGGTSRPGRGSTFWLELPAPAAAVGGKQAEPGPAGPLDGLSVLVVDDNATNRLVATRIVEQLGAAVDTASDGAMAVKAVTEADFDVVLMDIQMPVMDGVEATRTIRALPPPVGRIPIVAMTANVSMQQVAGYEAAGMDGAVAKPVPPATLLTELSRLSTAGSQDIQRLIYHSRASKIALVQADQGMAAILSVSILANRSAGLTGALLGCGGWFLQVLEGPGEAVAQTFARISSDARHEAVTVVDSSRVDRRLFGEWSMAGRVLTPTDAAIVSYLGRDGGFDPRGVTEDSAVALLLAVGALQKTAADRRPARSEDASAGGGQRDGEAASRPWLRLQ